MKAIQAAGVLFALLALGGAALSGSDALREAGTLLNAAAPLLLILWITDAWRSQLRLSAWRGRAARRWQAVSYGLWVASFLALPLFVLVRLGGGFGNIQPIEGSGWIGFLNAVKYPPSLALLLVTLGVLGILLYLFDRAGPALARWGRPLLVFGQVALFFICDPYFHLQSAADHVGGQRGPGGRQPADDVPGMGCRVAVAVPDLPDLRPVQAHDAAWLAVAAVLRLPQVRHQGGLAMKSDNYLIGLSILFFVLATGFSVVFWADVPLAARIAFFVLGFGSGVTAGQWFARRSA